MKRPPLALLATGLGVIGLVAAAIATDPAHSAALPKVAGGSAGGVVRASLVCPDLRIVPGTLATTVAVGGATPGTGSVTLSPAAGTGSTTTILKANQRIGTYGGPLTGPLTLQAQGQVANSLVAEQLSRGNKTGDRGWAEARCEPPRAEQWFVGAATTPGDTPVLELANPTDTNSVTDVTVFTPTGPSQTSLGNNISLSPHTVLRLKLSSLAPNATATAVRVETTSGRVSASVHDIRTNGLTLLGTDWVPVGGQGVTQTITGIPGNVVGAAPTRTLTVGDPGDVDATVQVQVITRTGTFVPVGLDAVTVAAGTVKSIDVSAALGATSGAVVVTSDDPTVPIVAGVFVDAPSTKKQPIHEIAYLGSQAPLRGAALIPLVLVSSVVDSVLVLSAPTAQVKVTLVTTPPTGAQIRQRIAVTARTSRALSLRAMGIPDGSTVTVVPDPGSPPVFGVRLIEEDGTLGPLLSAYELVGAPSAQQIPDVVAEPLGSS